MPITDVEVAIAAEKRLKWPVTNRLALQTMIPAALSNLAKEYACDPKKRPLLSSDPSVVTDDLIATVYGGDAELDLEELITTYSLMLEFIRYGTVYYLGATKTFTSSNLNLGDSQVLVAGAGTAAVNGTYTERGTEFGHPYYKLVGQPDTPTLVNSVAFDGSEWVIWDSAGLSAYETSSGDVPFPWDGTGWSATGGSNPAPTVTEVVVGGTEITITAHGYTTGTAVRLTTSGVLPTGFAALTTYYIIVVDANTIELASSLANAQAGTPITYTTTGSGTQSIVQQTRQIVQWLSSASQGTAVECLPFAYPTAWLRGTVMQMKNVAIGGNLEFNVPYSPATVADLPDDDTVTQDLIDALVAVALTADPAISSLEGGKE